MGRSDKPAIDYRFVDHSRYLEAAIDALGIEDVALVLDDWGSALGFHYARRHAANVRCLAFMEPLLGPVPSWQAFPPDAREMFESFRTPELGWELIARKDMFVEQMLAGSVVRRLSEQEMQRYREPFPDESSRLPVWRWPNEIPIEGEPADVAELVGSYNTWLQDTDLAKLLFYATPGALVQRPVLDWAGARLKNLETVDLGEGIHFLQEDHPHTIGRELANWLDRT